MSAPRVARDVVQSIKDALGQINLLPLGVGACLIVVTAAAGSGFALYQEIKVVNNKVSALQTSTEDVKARVDRMNVVVGGALSGIVGLLKEQALIEQTLARIESAALAPNSIIALTASEMAGIRAFFKLTKKTDEPPRFRVGDKIPTADLNPVPAIVYEKIAPRFQGTNFLIDQNGALVVTAGADNLVVLIVEPT